jgi:hypothetical protein
MHRLLNALLFFSLAITSPASIAEAPRWYEVEIALIGYQDSKKIDHENWPEILINKHNPRIHDELSHDQVPTDPWSWLNWWNNEKHLNDGPYSLQIQKADTENSILETPFMTKGLAFEDKLTKLSKAKDLQVVWSQKWRQPIPEKNDAKLAENRVNIDFKTALNFKQALKPSTPLLEIEVTGQLYLYRSRYLHLVSQLNVQHWQSLESISKLDKSIHKLPSHSNEIRSIIPSTRSTPLTAINEVPIRAAAVNQSRRMRSNELHYIDHPMLGMLVRVTPLKEK